MAADVKYRDIVREIALDHYGYVTTRDAAEAGVPAVELPKLAARGGLENVAYGLYRVPDVPPHAVRPVRRGAPAGGRGRVPPRRVGLALFGLADVNPRQIKVAVPRRTRPKLPPYIELTHVKDDVAQRRSMRGWSRSPSPTRILECRGRIETDAPDGGCQAGAPGGPADHRGVAACPERGCERELHRCPDERSLPGAAYPQSRRRRAWRCAAGSGWRWWWSARCCPRGHQGRQRDGPALWARHPVHPGPRRRAGPTARAFRSDFEDSLAAGWAGFTDGSSRGPHRDRRRCRRPTSCSRSR